MPGGTGGVPMALRKMAISGPPNVRAPRSKWGWSRRALVCCLVVVVLVAAARLCAPFLLRSAINRRLNEIPNYQGHVDSVSLSLWRGAYVMSGFRITKDNGRVPEPFVAADNIDFSVYWRDLLHGRFVSQIYIRNIQLNFHRGRSDEDSQLNADKRWQDVIHDLFPIDITFLDIKGGVLRFVDTTKTPKVDVEIRDLSIRAIGLRNRVGDGNEAYPAKVEVAGITMGGGDMRLYAKLEPLADKPHFEINLELKKMVLPSLNDFLHAYAGVTVSQGRFELFSQMAMKDGHYEGYVKPFFDDLHVEDSADKPLGERIWSKMVAAFAEFAKNSKTKQVATRIPFSGDNGALDIHTWKTIENALRHGFVKALSHGFEGTANPDKVTASGPAGETRRIAPPLTGNRERRKDTISPRGSLCHEPHR